MINLKIVVNVVIQFSVIFPGRIWVLVKVSSAVAVGFVHTLNVLHLQGVSFLSVNLVLEKSFKLCCFYCFQSLKWSVVLNIN